MAINTKIKNMAPGRDKFKRVIKLLSSGYYRPDAFPNGEVTVYPWDHTLDELVMKTARKMRQSPRLMWGVVDKIANLNGCPVDDLLIGDAATIILVSRALRSQDSLVYVPTCPHCGQDNAETLVKIPEDLARIGEKPVDYTGSDVITLRECGDTVRIRPLTIKDECTIESRSPELKKMVYDDLARILAAVVDVGGGQPDKLSELVEWYNALHPADQEQLNTSVADVMPQLDPGMKHECDFCKRHFVHLLPLQDPEFFRAGSQ